MPITPRIFGERGRNRAAALGIEPERVPPGQSPTVKWEVLMAEPQVDWSGDIHCVTRWSKFGMTWRGVSVAPLLERAGVHDDATHVLAHSYGGYTTNMPLSDLVEHPALIAYEADGEPLAREHGGPVRLLVPHLYLWKSAKWLN